MASKKKKFQRDRAQKAQMQRLIQQQQQQQAAVLKQQQEKADSLPDTFDLTPLDTLLDWHVEVGGHHECDPDSCPLAVKAFKIRSELKRRVSQQPQPQTLWDRFRVIA